MKKLTFYFLFVFLPALSMAQDRIITVGLQYKPIFASKFFGAGEIEVRDDIFKASIRPTWGHSYGMIIRRGINKTLSYEAGLNYTKRRYGISCTDLDSGFTDQSDFSLVSYEIPNQLLVYIRLGERFYMNNALGFAVTAFASDVQSFGTDRRFYHFSQMTTSFLSAAIIANVGFEYRSRKSGFFYLGASFHNPIKNISRSYITYQKDNFNSYTGNFNLRGTYLTVDLRYFFNESPIRQEKNKTKPK